jgi:hypothetical protein
MRFLRGSVAVVGLALAVYVVGRALDHGRAALIVAIATLMANALVTAIVRVRRFDALGADPGIATRHRVASFAQMLGSWVCFAGCALYLLRP